MELVPGENITVSVKQAVVVNLNVQARDESVSSVELSLYLLRVSAPVDDVAV